MNKIQNVNAKVAKLDARVTRVKALVNQIQDLERHQSKAEVKLDRLYERLGTLEMAVDNDIAVEIDATENQICYFEEFGNTRKVEFMVKRLHALELLRRKLAKAQGR